MIIPNTDDKPNYYGSGEWEIKQQLDRIEAKVDYQIAFYNYDRFNCPNTYNALYKSEKRLKDLEVVG